MKYQVVEDWTMEGMLALVNDAAGHGWTLHSTTCQRGMWYGIVQKDSGTRGSSSPRPVSSYGDYYGDQREQTR